MSYVSMIIDENLTATSIGGLFAGTIYFLLFLSPY